jgi:protein dithiol oxidoreductase (disulfide-forming)
MRTTIVLAALLTLVIPPLTRAQTWVEGKDYFPLVPAQPTHTARGKVEVAEVFSYGCPYCEEINPLVQKLKQSLAGNAEFVFVPASFNAPEDWPLFQRAVCTAQTLGIFDKTHDVMFDAVWKTGELAISDPQTHRLKSPLPDIEDVARVYNRISGVAVKTFIDASKSFAVDVRMRTDDALVLAYHVDGTPTFIINGKYRISGTSAGSMQRMIEIARWLVAKEANVATGSK